MSVEDLLMAQRTIGTLAYKSAASGQYEIVLMKNSSDWGYFKIVDDNLVMVITKKVAPMTVEEFQEAPTLLDTAIPCELCDGSGLRLSVPNHPGYGWIKCECWI